MKHKASKVMTIILSCALLLGVMGCTKSEPMDDAQSSEQVTLKFIWWGSEKRKEDTLKVIELYRQENPHVLFETQVVSSTSALSTQLAMDTADQTTADIIQGDYNFIFNYIDRDLIEPLDPWIENNTLDLSDVEPSYLEPGMKGDELYAMPVGNNAQSLVYDPELFSRLGVEVPAEGYTIEQLNDTMLQLKERSGSADFYPLGNMIDVHYYLRSHGATMYNKEGNSLGYEDDQILAGYFELYSRWVKEGLLLKRASDSVKLNEEHPMITGKSALYNVSSNSVTTLSELAGRPMLLLPFPTTGSAEGSAIKPSMFLSISSYSKHKEEAAKFIDFFINDVEANEILKGDRGLPVSSAISAHLAESSDGVKEQKRLIDYLQSHSMPVDPPYPSNYVLLNNAYNLALDNVIEGRMTPLEGARSYREQVEDIMKDEAGIE